MREEKEADYDTYIYIYVNPAIPLLFLIEPSGSLQVNVLTVKHQYRGCQFIVIQKIEFLFGVEIDQYFELKKILMNHVCNGPFECT